MPQLLDSIFHLDAYLMDFVSHYGYWTYLLLFAVIFAETGLIVTPFLPGDSLLFAVGALSAQPKSNLDFFYLFLLLLIAAVLGNQMNYSIGRLLGARVFSKESSWLLNKKHLDNTRDFYEHHGVLTLVMARFLPVIRSFAPFVAGISSMHHARFFLFNVLGGLLWVTVLLSAGYFLGSIPVVKNNFTLVIYGIIIVSLMLPLLQGLKLSRKKRGRGGE
jgi:membrane-associated protein